MRRPARVVAAAGLVGLLASLAAPPAALAGDIEGRVQVTTAVRRAGRRRGNDAYGTGSTPQPGQVQAAPRTEAQNVIVFIKESVPGNFRPPSERPVMAQVDATFVPRVLPVQAGTTVEFPNKDSIYHNIFSFSKSANFNLGRYPRGESRSYTFRRPGLVRVNCDIHAHMLAHVLVLPHPFHAVPGADGTFRIQGVPPGKYNLVAWHDNLPPQVRPLVVPARGTLKADFQF